LASEVRIHQEFLNKNSKKDTSAKTEDWLQNNYSEGCWPTKLVNKKAKEK